MLKTKCYTDDRHMLYRVATEIQGVWFVLKVFDNPRLFSVKMSKDPLLDQLKEWTTKIEVDNPDIVTHAKFVMNSILTDLILSKDVESALLYRYLNKDEERCYFTLDNGLIISFHRVDGSVVSCKIWQGTDVNSIIRYLPKGKVIRKPRLDDVSWGILGYSIYRGVANLFVKIDNI